MQAAMDYRQRLRYGYYLMRHENILLGRAAENAGVDPEDLFRYLWAKHLIRGTLIVLISYAWWAIDKLRGR